MSGKPPKGGIRSDMPSYITPTEIGIKTHSLELLFHTFCMRIIKKPRIIPYFGVKCVRKLCVLVYIVATTMPSVLGIILNSYLFSMLGQKFYEDVVMQTRNIILLIHILKRQNSHGIGNFLPFEKCAGH